MKKIGLVLGLVFVVAGIIFYSCQLQEKNAVVFQPTETENVQTVTSFSISEIDCLFWTYEELDAWAQNYIQGMTLEELNYAINTNECLSKWLDMKVERYIAEGKIHLEFKREAEWGSPKAEPVKPAEKKNCFNGNWEKLNKWAQHIMKTASDKAIINIANYNPCFRTWLYYYHPQPQSKIIRRVTTEWYINTFCYISKTTTYYEDGSRVTVWFISGECVDYLL